ncbi:hypothetical protein TNCV_1901021 [Trichonephila clavipes]|nr:hypothetical protein TNCV_1901021 [Trichonephila clavipes]
MGTSSGTQNAVANVLSRNPVESIIGEKVNCAIIRDLVISSHEQVIEEQRKDPELVHIYRYLENQKIARLMRQNKARTEGTVMSSTSGYNLRPRREEQKWIPNQSMRRRHSKEDQFESDDDEIISTAPT